MRKIIFSILFTIIALSSFAQHQFTRWVPTSGTDTYTAAITVPSYTAYTNSKPNIKFGNTNTGAATININSIGAVALRMWDGDSWEPLTASQIDVNTIYELAYTGTYFQMQSFGSAGGSQDFQSVLTTGSELTSDVSIVPDADLIGPSVGYGTNILRFKSFDLWAGTGRFQMTENGLPTDEVFLGHTVQARFLGGQSILTIGLNGHTFEDADFNKGFVYNANYSVNGKPDPRWIPDWGAVKSYADSAASAVGGGLTVGTTAIASGTTTRVLYDNAGTLGEYVISGVGNVAMTTSPTIATPSITTGYTIGGTAATGTFTRGNGTNFVASTLTLPNSATTADILIATGTNAIGSLAKGTGDQILGMNSGATSHEWKSLSAGQTLSVTDGTNIDLSVAGSSSIALVNSASISASITGTIAVVNGGTGADNTTQTYTPTLTNTTNVGASTPRQCTYFRVGNVVTVSGQLDIDTTAPAQTVLGISLPIASAFTTAFQLGGTAAPTAVADAPAGIIADATNDRATLSYVCVDITNHTLSFTFTYQVL